jgi:3-isopropylmalate dehydratase small subunit
LPEKEIPAKRVDTAEIILTGKTWVVRGALPSDAIVSDGGQGTLGTAGELVLATGPMGEGEMAAQAVAALQRNGIIGVIAPAFAWPFFRLCVNLGLPPLTLWEAAEIRTGDRLRADLTGQVVKNLSSGTRYPIRNLSDLYVAILACGGMTGYIRALRAER